LSFILFKAIEIFVQKRLNKPLYDDSW
jgi:hypothetical protein